MSTSEVEMTKDNVQEPCEYCKRGLKTMCLCNIPPAQPAPMRKKTEMKIVATSMPKTIEEYQLALDAAWTGGQALGKALASQPAAQRQSVRSTWVGLTDEEIDKTQETQVWDARRSYARAIEAKLKEKNT
jgi:hypothetical protein